MSSDTPIMQHTSPLGPDGIVRCKHGEEAARLVSLTQKNPNRVFYKCSREDPGKCGFFLWGDNPILNNPPPQAPAPPASSPSSRSVPNGISTPRPSPFHSASTSTLQSTPAKRNRSEGSTNLASANTSSKKARLEAIEAGLRARGEGQSPYQPSQPNAPDQADVLPFTHGVEAPSPASDTATDIGQEVESPPARYSFLGLPPSQESIKSGVGPRTPKKRPSSISDGRQSSFGSPSALLTPPQTVQQHTHRTESSSAGGSSRLEPITPTRNKGKQRANARFDEFMQAEEDDNPFVDAPSSSLRRKLDSGALGRAWYEAHSQGEPCTPTMGERITADMREMLGTIDTLRTFAERLAVLDPLRYIERLERQRSALEVADAAKKKRIDELMEEIRQRDDTIARLKTGRR